jgi:hypothetical protein
MAIHRQITGWQRALNTIEPMFWWVLAVSMEFAGRCVTNWRSTSLRDNLGVIAGHPMQLVILVYMGLIGLIYMALSGFILRV